MKLKSTRRALSLILCIAAMIASSLGAAQSKISYMAFRDCSESAWNAVGTYPFQRWTGLFGKKGWDADLVGFTGISQGPDAQAKPIFGGAGGVYWRISDQARLFTGVSLTGEVEDVSRWRWGIALGFSISASPPTAQGPPKTVYIGESQTPF